MYRSISTKPKHSKVDRQLRALGADASVGEDVADDANHEDEVSEAAGAGDDESDTRSEGDAAVVAEEVDEPRSFAQEGVADITAPDETAVVVPDVNNAQAAEVDGSMALLRVLEDARKQLMDVGAAHAAGQPDLEFRKERSRLREVSREDPDVLLGMARARDALEAESRKRRLAIEDANRQVMSKQKLRREIKDAGSDPPEKKPLIAEQ